MIGVKAGVGYLSYKGVTKWLESIHKDTLEHGTEDQQFVFCLLYTSDAADDP